ncbi:adenosylcobinamide-phosphate synthase CbiB [Desulforamulus ruminis]|uniref:Cobalamin biosynthesis protein CobD n=1 Tax=Desulforamulus ruminis (strain ATCC 23193 / DSM 2154 / NCIMB 8452 / DL) TaxID=696281 RepID=F6DJX1_DESRL|nr:adenosylcobinamide-phosphate synthase CbiB [Desulforamulus ruminis]AEG59185.1 cobalamin biosynthesis protein CobD [Desulforamulus ruminis DSM 2154]
MSGLILGALLIDLMVGDPRWIPHPVVLMGKLISRLEAVVRRATASPWGLRLGGVLLVILVCLSTYWATGLLIQLAGRINPYLGMAVHLWLLSTTLAIKSLTLHARAVAIPLAKGDLPLARRKLSLIVGRDTEHLEQGEIARAAVETVAENTVDGIVAPLFFAFIGGAPLAMAYKAVNTMDSMLGYRDQRYRYLGWAAARLDDLANYLPARLAGLFYLMFSPLTPGRFKGVLRGILQDAPGHPSPNSGIPEAAVAGAFKIQLGGTNYYRGEASHRPKMGAGTFPLPEHIQKALNLTYGVTLLSTLAGILISYLLKVADYLP